MTRRKKIIWSIVAGLVVLICALSIRPTPKIIYGVSFSKFHSDELKLDWKATYLAILNDLGVKNLRLSAHWPMIQPKKGQFNFEEIDFQMREAKAHNASVILVVGRRAPGWPECHEPDWAKDLPTSQKQAAILIYIKNMVERYKGYSNILYWQVENEPFLGLFSRSACGTLDQNFLKSEVALVHQIDPAHKVLITDSGELGTWYQAQQVGDAFGTSVYLYIFNHQIGKFRYPLIPAFFRIKRNLLDLFFGKKPDLLIELEAEPWLIQPLVEAPTSLLLDRMGPDKLKNMISFASKTGFERQYLWGAEWWYWMKLHGNPELWQIGKDLFSH